MKRPTLRAAARPLTAALFVLFVVVVVRTAWLCDDAYITFRTVENFASGNGLTWNVTERVQTYTHPLWLLFLIAARAVTHENYFSALALSCGVSLAAFLLITRRVATTPEAGLLGAMALVSSKAFIDFSTSGLENPLTHLLLAVFFLCYWARIESPLRLAALSGAAGLACLNRLDLALLLLPALAIVWFERPTLKRLAIIGGGAAPLFIWLCFSLLYYGFPFPNTAYAKLRTGIAAGDLALHGLAYLADSLRADPLPLVSVAFAIAAGIVSKGWRGRAVSLGLVLYLAYVVRVGGDFMSGRFLTPPFVAAVCLLVRVPLRATPLLRAAPFATVGLIAILWPATLRNAAGYVTDNTSIAASGITDECAHYYRFTGLLRDGGRFTPPRTPHWDLAERMRTAGQRVAVRDMVGFFGYAARGEIHIVDSLGLGDPLLARLPAEPGWRIGHYARRLPNGYIDSLRRGGNRIVDPHLAHYYEQLRTITRGRIWQMNRLATIAMMNLGQYEHDVAMYVRRSQLASSVR